ncbi:MAG: c-type cytochrome [Sphingobacteriales bacterium]|nr:c-type cytochrome [Sphingobacteriales bacterium]
MRTGLILLLSVLVFSSCGGGSSNKEKNNTPATSDVTKNPDYQKGLELVSKSNCLTCHKVDEKLTGPPYREVANKYAGMPDTIIKHLAGKIIGGGNGVWGEIFMTPHPDISQADAEAMVKYILLLKK